MALVGPGALQEYSAPSRGRRARGSVYVDDPAVGFFVAGSSIDDLNGIYVRTNSHVLPRHRVAMAYAHQEGGWTLALCATAREDRDSSSSDDDDDAYEWRFVDAQRVDRFTHEGDTLIPGAGARWSHAVHGSVGDGRVGEDRSLVNGRSEEELEDELPWQVIALLDAAITRDLLRSNAWRAHKVQRAKQGADLPKLAAASLEAIAAQEEEEPGWLYRAGVDGAGLFERPDGRQRDSLAAGRYARIVEKQGEWLRRADGKWLRAADVSEASPHAAAPAAPEEVDADSVFDRPFEARIEGEDASETVGEEEDDAEEPATAAPPAIVPAQRARDLAVGDECELLAAGFELAGRMGTIGTERKDGRYAVVVDDRTVSVAFWQVHGGDGGADHKLLGLSPEDVTSSKGAAIDAAYRAAARDAVYASRLVRGATSADEESIRGARDNLLEDYSSVTGYEAAASCDAWAGRSPLELVQGGMCGVRAADAARAAASPLIEAAARGALALKQVVADEAQRATDLASLEEGDAVLLRCALVAAYDACRRREAALAEALRAANADPHNAAALTTLGLLELPRRRTSALVTLKSATLAGASKSPAGAWGAARAASVLRACTRAASLKNKADDAYLRGALDASIEFYGEAIATAPPEDSAFVAVCYSNRAACRRRTRDLVPALEDCDRALELYPGYARALFRKACVLLELDRPAVDAFVAVLRFDRDWPDLVEWLARAEARERRRANGETTMPPPPPSSAPATTVDDIMDESKFVDHYTILGVSADATEAQLKRAYCLRSLKYHPDKKTGSTLAFQRVREAFDTLSDPAKRRAYDLGDDIKKPQHDSDSSEYSDDEHAEPSLREEVERKYWPERYQFLPFGDPFVQKRKLRARRARAKTRGSFF